MQNLINTPELYMFDIIQVLILSTSDASVTLEYKQLFES